MAIGLSRSANLSESDLNLNEGIQKLYRPGIQEDLDLFTLSSSLESLVSSGTSSDAQIFGLTTETVLNAASLPEKRTKFITRTYTFSNFNSVVFRDLAVNVGPSVDVVLPKLEKNGAVHILEIVSNGLGFYFTNTADVPLSMPETVVVENVPLIGEITKSAGLRATITFKKHDTSYIPSSELTAVTPSITDRYTVLSIVVTTPSSGYEKAERISIPPTASGKYNSVPPTLPMPTVKIKKQEGKYFSLAPSYFTSKPYVYQIRNASSTGFYVFDTGVGKYVFLDNESSVLSSSAVVFARDDSLLSTDFLNFKLSQSYVYMFPSVTRTEAFSIPEGSISSVLNSFANQTSGLEKKSRLFVQNTLGPTAATHPTNHLGFPFNEYVGEDFFFQQRVVVRDPDFRLNSASTDVSGGTISLLNFSAGIDSRFEVPDLAEPLNPDKRVRVPGVYINVGGSLARAFSTNDKPFIAQALDGAIFNPILDVAGDVNLFSISAMSADNLTGVPYAYNVTVGTYGQRLSFAPTLGLNGAFYFHYSTGPSLSTTVLPSAAGDNTTVAVHGMEFFTIV